MSDVTYYIQAEWSFHSALQKALSAFGVEPIYKRNEQRQEDPFIRFLSNFLQVRVPEDKKPAVEAALDEAGGKLWVRNWSTSWDDFRQKTPAPEYKNNLEGRIPEPHRRYSPWLQGPAIGLRRCSQQRCAA